MILINKYIKSLYHIFLNYKFYSFIILLKEFFFIIKFGANFNKFKYLNSNYFSDSIPCPYFFLDKIRKYILDNNILSICDLGSGYGKVLFYFGKIYRHKIEGVEFIKEIYNESKVLIDNNISVTNNDIKNINFLKKKHNLYILNDPLKKTKDLQIIIKKLKGLKKNIHIIFINMSLEKYRVINRNLKIKKKFSISQNKNILFCVNN